MVAVTSVGRCGRAAASVGRRTVLFFGNVPYETCWQRPQQLARGLARRTPVLYVNPHRSVGHRWLRRPLAVEALPGKDGPLQLLEPPAGFPLARTLGWLHRLNCRRTWRCLCRHFPRPLAHSLRAAVATFPDQWELIRRLPPEVPVVYDIMDDFILFLRPWQCRRYAAMHAALLKRANLVLTSSRVLHCRHRHLAGRLVYLGNGVSEQLWRACSAVEPDRELLALPSPRLGYVGMLSHWMDFKVIRALAAAFPHGSIVLVGPRDLPVPPLPANVHVCPAVRQERLPGILRAFDLGLIPFVRSPGIDAVNPVKLYEYLAAGLPVLAADFAEMRGHARHAALYCSPAEAVAQARMLLTGRPTPQLVDQRREYAAAHTWERLADRLWRLLGDVDRQR
ncbi:MAG: glycosyltransferase [Gemmataceae bacterium]|nr:glycosyltransferase [Gemmataceae bacterium]MDW8267360.1 glycosyltransferase [Gemmataceae bacterium]